MRLIYFQIEIKRYSNKNMMLYSIITNKQFSLNLDKNVDKIPFLMDTQKSAKECH